LIAFGALAYSVNSASMWIVLGVVFLSAIGLLLLLLPRFTPRAPRWMERFVPPRYRRRGSVAALAPEASTPASAADQQAAAGPENRTPVVSGVAGVNGATAIGPRSRLADRRKAGTR
jgi:UDP-GlcNAc:undecaprenyl-phosphate GlcNAc-1-phosphate transferase